MTDRRVLVIEDSRTFARVLRDILDDAAGIECIGAVPDAFAARDAILQYKPDVLTLDLAMPGMDGVEFVGHLMRQHPLPVVVVSGLIDRVDVVRELKEAGVSALVSKTLPRDLFAEKLVGAVRNAALPGSQARTGATLCTAQQVIAIGSSTGGIAALRRVLEAFPRDCPPTLVCQHQMREYLASTAARLDQLVAPKVRLAQGGEPLTPGTILLADKSAHLGVRATPSGVTTALVDEPPRHGHLPSVDVLFESLAPLGERVSAALLTGMGRDGAAGLLAIRRAGGHTFAQDQETSAVFGMPKAALEDGAVDRTTPLHEIASRLLAPRASSPSAAAASGAAAASR